MINKERNMSIVKIKELALTLESGKLFSGIISTPFFGNTNIRQELTQFFELIQEYKEPDPKIDAPPKPRTRRARTTKKENTTE